MAVAACCSPAAAAAAASSFAHPALQTTALTGSEWYRQQAARTVNQAVGRVIRHRNDYGAIIFCDERFTQQGLINAMPKWVRPFLNVFQQFGEAQGSLVRFFKRAAAMPELQPAGRRPHVALALEPDGQGPPARGAAAPTLHRAPVATGVAKVAPAPVRLPTVEPVVVSDPSRSTGSLLAQLKQATEHKTAAAPADAARATATPAARPARLFIPTYSALSAAAEKDGAVPPAQAPRQPQAQPQAPAPAKQFLALVCPCRHGRHMSVASNVPRGCVCRWTARAGQVKEALPPEAFKTFSQLLVDFRAGKVDMPALLEQLWSLVPEAHRVAVLTAFQPFASGARRAICASVALDGIAHHAQLCSERV